MITKPSGIKWIGNIPVDWEISRFKYLTVNANTGEAISKEFWDPDGDYLLYTAGQIPIRTTFNEFPKDIMTTENDILVARNGAGAIQIPQLGSIYTDHVIRFTIKDGSSLKFIYYTLLLGMEKIVSEAIDVSLKTLSRSDWDNLSLPFPTLSEQRAIAAFLDTQCKKIDDIITELEQQIEILKQYKTSLITETVTKGMDKSISMKNSGIEWIGKIPAHWEIGRIKYCYDIILGKMLQSVQERNKDKEMYYMCAVNITWEGIDLSTLKQMWFSPSEIKMYLLQEGDLLVTEGGDVAIACIWNNELQECCIQNALHLIKNNGKYLNNFLCYWLYFLKHTGYIDLVCNKATIAHFTKEKFGESPICIIPFEEQKAISNFLDEKITSTNQIITEKQQSIDTMKAYKKSLIYEYVTGKKRVKGYS